MSDKTIEIARDFSKFPAGRYRSDGPYSGEVFRKDFLEPAIENYDQVNIKIDNVSSFGSSFLEEAFGGLIRDGYTKEFLSKKLNIQAETPIYMSFKREIEGYLRNGGQ